MKIKLNHEDYVKFQQSIYFYKCTICNKKYIQDHFNFCPNCGKEIEWI